MNYELAGYWGDIHADKEISPSLIKDTLEQHPPSTILFDNIPPPSVRSIGNTLKKSLTQQQVQMASHILPGLLEDTRLISPCTSS
jgi:hypothetical protein